MMIETLLLSYYLHQVTPPKYYEQTEQPSLSSVMHTEGKGTLSVQLAAPEDGRVAPGSQRVEMLEMTLSATCDADISVSEITLTHAGLGERSDISAVYAVTPDARRVSTSATFASSDQTLRLRLRGFTVPACGEETLTILADFSQSAAAGGEHRIELRSVQNILSSARMLHLEQAIASLTRRTQGKSVGFITFESLPLTQNVHYGSRQVVGRFRLTADSGDDHEVHAITLTNEGSASNTDLRNLFIQGGRQRLSAVTDHLRADRVRIVLDPPLLLKRHETRLLELRADVRVGASKTLRFVLDASGDLEAVPVRSRR